jgi:hypothetical protein
MRIITWISVCDLIANASQLNGVPADEGWCTLQAVVDQFFYPASWLWTVILTYLLYSLVAHGKISLAEWKMHLIVWGICTAITVLPLTTSTYGIQTDDDGWCWIQVSSHRSGGKLAMMIWSLITFDIVIYGCFFVMLTFIALIVYKLQIQHIIPNRTVYSALRALMQYPAIFFVCWFPNALFPQNAPTAWQIAIYCLSTWQGGLTAIAFFMNSRESRMLWGNVFSQYWCCCRRSIDLDTVLLTVIDVENEDFESDDAYYGRSTTTGSEFRPDSIVTLTQLSNPSIRSR